MRHYVGFGLLVLSLPLIIFGILGTTQVASVILGVLLAGVGIVTLVLGQHDRRRMLNFDAVLQEADAPHLRSVPKPPKVPDVDVPATDAEPSDEPVSTPTPPRRPEMLPPPMEGVGQRTGIRLVHTDGKRLILRNRPRKTGSGG